MLADDPNQQAAALRRRVGGDIYARSQFHRGRLDRAGLGKSVRRPADLVRLPPMSLDDVRTPATLLLRRPGVKARGVEDRRYRPVRWVRSGGALLAYSAEDLDLLAESGAAIFDSAGVSSTDVVANLVPLADGRDHLQLTTGAHRAAVPSMTLEPGSAVEDVDAVSPTVVAGAAAEIVRLLDDAVPSGALDRVHTALVVGAAPDHHQARVLADRLGHHEGSIVRAWAPDGVLALWSQCRGGVGFHTWPTLEIIEVVDPLSGLPVAPHGEGALVWTGTGWHATALLRLQTGATARLIDGPCPDCGRLSPRLEPVATSNGFADVLDQSAHVADWVAELQPTPLGDQLAIWIVPADPAASLLLLDEIDRRVGSAQVVITDSAELERRLAAANGERFVDRRALPVH